MYLKILETLITYVIVYALAFDDIFVDGHNSNEMIEQGRTQYQLLKEKGNLPRYGTCWKGAIDHVEDGCRNLSEDTQSDIALHITNCFLEMSGHSTYNCELNKKPNLRSYCINSMSDRAFNVYTEFYTHVQNICWFLRGQIWYETISENSLKVGQQLEASARSQEQLLEAQKESLELQSRILQHERLLEKVLQDLYVSTKSHQEVLGILAKSIGSLQAWVIEEASWFDSLAFYFVAGVFVFFFTSTQRTANLRVTVLLLLFFNLVIERFLCSILTSGDDVADTRILYQNIYSYVWYCRYFFIFIIVIYFIFNVYHYKDISLENYKFLQSISQQNSVILETLCAIKSCVKRRSPTREKFDLVDESLHHNGFLKESVLEKDESGSSTCSEAVRGRKSYTNRRLITLTNIQNDRYNLRSSKQNTPELK